MSYWDTSTLGELNFLEASYACAEIPLGRQKLKVLSLERILTSKLAANRAKDKLTIPVLRDALAAIQSVKPQTKRAKSGCRRRKERRG